MTNNYFMLNWNVQPTFLVMRSEEHTSELQSLTNLVCRLLLEKKKKQTHTQTHNTTNKDTAKQSQDHT